MSVLGDQTRPVLEEEAQRAQQRRRVAQRQAQSLAKFEPHQLGEACRAVSQIARVDPARLFPVRGFIHPGLHQAFGECVAREKLEERLAVLEAAGRHTLSA